MMRWLPLLLVLSASPAWAAATYFVSFATGSNANAGTSSAAPWKTPPGSWCVGPAATCGTPDTGTGWVPIQSGDTIQLNRGESYPIWWRYTSTWYPMNPAAAVVLQDYGTGTLPDIDGSTSVGNIMPEWGGSFAIIDSINGIYAFNFNFNRFFHQPNTLSGDNLHIFRNNSRWGIGSTFGNTSGGTACTSAGLPSVGMMYQDLANSRVCFKSTTDPNTDNSHWRVGYRPYGISLEPDAGVVLHRVTIRNLMFEKKGLVVQGPTEFGGEIHCGGGQTCSDITVDGVTVFQSGGSGIRNFPTSAGSNINSANWTIQNSTIDSSFLYGIEFQNVDSTTIANWRFLNNVSHDNGDHGISASIADTITVKNNTFYRNAVGQSACLTTPACGPQGQDRGNNMTFTGTATGAPNRVKDLDIEQNIGYAAGPSHTNTGGTDGSCLYIDGALGVNKVLNNVCTGGNGYGFMLQYDQAPEAVVAWDIEGNTFGNDGNGGICEFNGGFFDGTHTVTMQNNIFGADTAYTNAGGISYGVLWKSFPVAGIVWNHNLVNNAGNNGRDYFCNGTVQLTACPGWSNDVNADPLWNNSTPTVRDFSLKSTSPARNAGTATCPAIPTDLVGTTRPQETACEMGSYEYIAGGTTTTSSSTSTSTSSTIAGAPVGYLKGGKKSGGTLK